MAIDPTLRDALSAVTPASLARALTRAGVKAHSVQGLTGRGGSAIGTAYTLRMIPARDDAAGDLAGAIDAIPEGAIVVIDAAKSGLALPFGSILSARLAHRGVAGLVTDGALPAEVGLPVWSVPEIAIGALALVGTQQPVWQKLKPTQSLDSTQATPPSQVGTSLHSGGRSSTSWPKHSSHSAG